MSLQTKYGVIQLSTASNLPAELLSQIFTHCLDDEMTPNLYHSLLAASMVCRMWRDACLCDPSLWSSLRMSSEEGSELCPGLSWDLWAMVPSWWFKRAGSHSLRFSLQSKCHNLPTSPLSALVPFSPRIIELCANVWEAKDLEPMISMPSGSFPTLQTLELIRVCSAYNNDIPEDTPFRWVFEEATPLRHLILGRGCEYMYMSKLSFPWHKLHTLRVDTFISPEFWFQLLLWSTNLHHGVFCISPTGSDPDHLPLGPVIHESVWSLDILFFELYCSLSHGYLQLPNLQTLRLAQMPAIRGPMMELNLQCDNFRRISAPNLRCLILAGLSLDSNILLQFLHSCTKLEELCIGFTDGDLIPELYTILDALENGTSTRPRPPLHLISFSICLTVDRLHSYDFETIYIRIVRSFISLVRLWRQDTLEEVTVFLQAFTKDDDGREFHDLRQQVSRISDMLYQERSHMLQEGFSFEIETILRTGEEDPLECPF